MGNYDLAIESYTDCLRREPRRVEAVYNIGVIYQDHKQMYKEAIKYYRRALALNPNFGQASGRLDTLVAKGHDKNWEKRVESSKDLDYDYLDDEL